LKITSCRLCGSNHIEKVVDLGFHPPADTFLPERLILAPETSYPLQLGLCHDCGHVFTLFAVSPEDRYQKHDYSYDSSNSKVAIEHFKEFAQAVITEAGLNSNSLVVDIGSNIGTLLSHVAAIGKCKILGVEPSSNIAALAVKQGVPTIVDFFNASTVSQILKHQPVDALLSSNVVNHADDLNALLVDAKSALASNGVFVFEVPYLLDLVQGTAFDTIYHEHVHYYGVKPLAACLARHGFTIYKVERLDYMCGSIRVYAKLGSTPKAEIVRELEDAEMSAGLYQTSTYVAFMKRVRATKIAVNTYLLQTIAQGGKVLGIGAATKGNTFLNYCRLDADIISVIADASPLKIGKLTPGSHIPIISDDDIASVKATHALILPWNIGDFLKAKLAHLGLEFYVPQVEVLRKI
jgi:SAM-dependent methyltransferase